ncbi:MAG: YggS family pyridoxal phosphate-dependent enzyme [Candidatus Cloacimonetes bacterium]|nr:YggS family pyridoxal phosphate-dependent enzyme [Candidatus Cloacimonadota bacterium]
MSIITKNIEADTTLIAVSKTHPITKIRKIFEQGIQNFGENRVQEFLEKYEELSDLDIRWHFIGNLQRNKVKKVIGKVSLIQSIDSVALYQKLVSECKKRDIVQDCLLQINVSNESQKGGFALADLSDTIAELVQYDSTYAPIKGLMCIGSNIKQLSEDTIINEFDQMNRVFLELKEKYSFSYLSMGMSGDYILAQKHGSNMVRVGSLLFGGRELCTQK